MILEPAVETRPWDEQLALDDDSYRDPARLPVRALRLLPREARGRGALVRRRRRWAGGHRPAAPDRQAGAQGDLHARESDRRPSLRRPVRARSHLLDERHYRSAELRAPHRRRSGELGHGLGPELRGFRRRARSARGHDLQRRAVRCRGGARLVRAHRPLSPSVRDREHRAPAAGDRRPQARGGGVHALVCGPPDRMGGRPRHRSARVERRARPRGRRAGRRRARLSRDARAGLGRAGHRGDGDRRPRRLALGRVRGAGRHAPRRAGLSPRGADRPGHRHRPRAGRRGDRRARPDASPAPRRAGLALPHP